MYANANTYGRLAPIQKFLSNYNKSTYVLHIFRKKCIPNPNFQWVTTKNEYPRYHRLATSRLKDVTFEVDMPDKDPTSSKLVYFLFFNIIFMTPLKKSSYSLLC